MVIFFKSKENKFTKLGKESKANSNIFCQLKD